MHVSPTSIRSRILKATRPTTICSTRIGFTHVDPFEDTERIERDLHRAIAIVVSPTSIRSRILKAPTRHPNYQTSRVSPTSIRSRILKVSTLQPRRWSHRGFTHVDPFEDTERYLRLIEKTPHIFGFTHVDPFEDTESCRNRALVHWCIEVSPTSIRSRILKVEQLLDKVERLLGFTHVDPFEDTESAAGETHDLHPW